MSAYLFFDDEITDARPLHDFGSSVCWFLHDGHYCSLSRMSVASFWVVFSIVSSVPDACRFCFSLLFSVSLGRDACCDADGIILPSIFWIRESACLHWILVSSNVLYMFGKVSLQRMKVKRMFFLLNSGAKVFQVPSCGILAGFLLAPGEREFWSIIDNDVTDAVVEISEHQFVAAAALGTCRSQPEKLEAVQSGQIIQFFIKVVRGTQTQVVRGGRHVALGLVAGVMGMDVHAMVGGKIVDHSLSLESLGITSPSSPGFVVGLVITCLGSGRVQYASRSVAGQRESSAIGVVLLVMLTLSL